MWHAYGFQISLRASPVSWLKLECHLMSRASLIFLGRNLSSVVCTSLWSKSTYVVVFTYGMLSNGRFILLHCYAVSFVFIQSCASSTSCTSQTLFNILICCTFLFHFNYKINNDVICAYITMYWLTVCMCITWWRLPKCSWNIIYWSFSLVKVQSNSDAIWLTQEPWPSPNITWTEVHGFLNQKYVHYSSMFLHCLWWLM